MRFGLGTLLIMKRRTFLASSLAASTAVTATAPRLVSAPAGTREYYELRCYRLKPGASRAPVEGYLEKALLPALDRSGLRHTGVFTQIEVNKNAGTSTPKSDTPIWVLITHPTLDSFVRVSAEINTDAALRRAGAAYLQTPKASPAYDRIDSWLLLAFRSMPKMEIPAFVRSRAPGRVFEMRDYESHSEEKALIKMAMFDEGETEIMRSLGMSPMFFGQALAGPNLPHLRYFTAGSDLAAHLANWKKFGPDPRWVKMKDNSKYADSTSKNTARFLVPTAYSAL